MTKVRPDYEHLRCSCGGVIGDYRKGTFTCDTCEQEYHLYELIYDNLQINQRTGWLFPMRYKR